MAGKKTKNRYQPVQKEENPAARSAKIMRVIFLILSIMIVLSMILTAAVTF